MDLERFKTNIIPLRDKLFTTSLMLLGDKDDAEDSVQEALLKLWSIREKLDAYDNLGGFAMQTAKNIAIDKLRSRKMTVEPEDFYLGKSAHTPHSQMEEKESVELIRKIIDSLPQLQQRIILMRDVEGYELDEIAQIVGTQVSAVTMNLSRARKKVREKFLLINSYLQKSS